MYADWLDEHGDAVRAEFIRVQVELARLPDDDQRRPDLEDREAALLVAHEEEWCRELPGGEWWKRSFRSARLPDRMFRRGFTAEVSCRAEQFLTAGPQLFAVAPVEAVRLDALGWTPEVMASPLLARLRTLDLHGERVTAAEAAALAASPHLHNLRELDLAENQIGDDGVAALAASPHLTSLTLLDLYHNQIGSRGLAALVASPLMNRLRTLDLGAEVFGDRSVRILLKGNRLRGLRDLGLRGLRDLGLGNNQLGDADARLLAGASCLAGLERLDLDGNPIRAGGVLALACSPHLARLRSLELANIPLTAEGVGFLAKSPYLSGLRQLSLASGPSYPESQSGLGAEGMRALARSRALTNLTHLALHAQKVGDAGLAALAAWPGLRSVRRLNLHANEVGDEKFAELEKRADELAKRFPEKGDQARIWAEVAHVAAQSGIDRHADRVRKYAAKCLAVSRDPLQRGRMYSYLASAVDLSGAAFAGGRREAAVILLRGYAEMLAQDLPEKAPELPGVERFEIDGDPVAVAQARARQAAQRVARQEAEFTRDLIARRDTLVMQLRDLYKPEPNYHGRNPEGPDELRALAKRKLTGEQVKVLLEKVTK